MRSTRNRFHRRCRCDRRSHPVPSPAAQQPDQALPRRRGTSGDDVRHSMVARAGFEASWAWRPEQLNQASRSLPQLTPIRVRDTCRSDPTTSNGGAVSVRQQSWTCRHPYPHSHRHQRHRRENGRAQNTELVSVYSLGGYLPANLFRPRGAHCDGNSSDVSSSAGSGSPALSTGAEAATTLATASAGGPRV